MEVWAVVEWESYAGSYLHELFASEEGARQYVAEQEADEGFDAEYSLFEVRRMVVR